MSHYSYINKIIWKWAYDIRKTFTKSYLSKLRGLCNLFMVYLVWWDRETFSPKLVYEAPTNNFSRGNNPNPLMTINFSGFCWLTNFSKLLQKWMFVPNFMKMRKHLLWPLKMHMKNIDNPLKTSAGDHDRRSFDYRGWMKKSYQMNISIFLWKFPEKVLWTLAWKLCVFQSL